MFKYKTRTRINAHALVRISNELMAVAKDVR